MSQQDLKAYFEKDSPSLREEILTNFEKGISGRKQAKRLGISNNRFDRLLNKLNIVNPSRKKQQSKIKDRIRLRKEGKSICEIGRIHNVSDQAIYYTLKRHAPELLSKEFIKKHQLIKDEEFLILTTVVSKILTKEDMPKLLTLREEKYSLGAIVTYPQRPSKKKLWYLQIQRNKQRKIIGRISRNFLLMFFPESEIAKKETTKTPYFSLNSILDNFNECD